MNGARGRRFALLLALVVGGCARGTQGPAPQASARPVLIEQISGTRSLLQAVSAVNDSVVWVSGHRATWAVTIDAGMTWRVRSWTDADSILEFRDVHAVDASTAYLLAAGPGPRSRIYKTRDGGANWQLQFFNGDPRAFYDCFDFWDATHGIAVSDAVNGKLIVIATEDGEHWTDISGTLPAALEGEGAFAASGTCLVTRGRSHAWIGSGAESGSRVYHTSNRGQSWSVSAPPVVSGAASGVASVAFRDEHNGLALGGRLADNNDQGANVARTSDGGVNWKVMTRTSFSGAVFGSAWIPGSMGLVAVGPRGLAWTPNGGDSWTTLTDQAHWAVGFGTPTRGWAVGPNGRITRLDVPR